MISGDALRRPWSNDPKTSTGSIKTTVAARQSSDRHTRVWRFKTGDGAKDAWIDAYVAELLQFPGSPVTDQVDASSAAFAALQGMAFIDERNNADIGRPYASRDTGFSNGIDDIWPNPDASSNWDGGRDESNDGFEDRFNVRGSLF
jgi:hypothetical protein